MPRLIAIAWSVWIVIAAAVSIAQAGIDIWDGNAIPATAPNGIWRNSANWVDDSTPRNGDTAVFNIANSYAVTFDATPLPIHGLTVSAGAVTFTGSGGPRVLYVDAGSGSQDVSITGSGAVLALGTSGNTVGLIIGDHLSPHSGHLSVESGATLSIRFGSDVRTPDLVDTGINGTIDVDGSGSSLEVDGAGSYAIATTGDGNLIVRNGATTDIAGDLAVAAGAQTGGISVLTGGRLNLGGNLMIATGDIVGQNGSVSINGTNTTNSWFYQSGASSITVGSASNGTAAINIGTMANFGRLDTGTGTLMINATGTVTVGSGANTGQLVANGDVTINGGRLFAIVPPVGSSAGFHLLGGKTLTIQNGGSANFTSGNSYQVGAGKTYVVTGAGSTWTIGTTYGVQVNGTLTIEAGGSVSNTAGSIGATSGSTATVTVTGDNSTWTNSSLLTVGGGDAGTLRIEAGGSVSSAGGVIGNSFATTSSVTVTGAGSNWNNTSTLVVGNFGTSTLTIAAGGSVSNSSCEIGAFSGSAGTIIVTGADSTWNNTTKLTVGAGSNGTLMIESGGSVSSAEGIIGYLTDSTGTVAVTGAGSKWTNIGDLTVGSSGPGTLGSTGTLTMTSGGEVVVGGSLLASATGRVRLDSGKLTINQFGAGGLDALDWHSGTLRLTAASGLTVGAGGLFGDSLALDAGQHLEVDDTLTIASSADLFTSGALSAGALVNNGDLILSSTTVNGPVTHSAGAAITAIGSVTFNNLVSGPGGFYGPGTITFAGGMAPGGSPAAVNFEGSVTLADTNTLFMEIGGTTRGSQYDAILVGGALTLGGTLNVTIFDGFTPQAGNSFDLFDGASLSGAFDMVSLPALSPGLMWNASQLYSTGALRVFLAGDYDGNGTVDAADYTVWRNMLGQNGTGLAADGNGDHMITRLDFNVWKANYGIHAGSGSAWNATVPEPNSPALVVVAALGIFRRGRVKRRESRVKGR